VKEAKHKAVHDDGTLQSSVTSHRLKQVLNLQLTGPETLTYLSELTRLNLVTQWYLLH
jgi:hypothetical protein